jgi:hypothetical protein
MKYRTWIYGLLNGIYTGPINVFMILEYDITKLLPSNSIVLPGTVNKGSGALMKLISRFVVVTNSASNWLFYSLRTDSNLSLIYQRSITGVTNWESIVSGNSNSSEVFIVGKVAAEFVLMHFSYSSDSLTTQNAFIIPYNQVSPLRNVDAASAQMILISGSIYVNNNYYFSLFSTSSGNINAAWLSKYYCPLSPLGGWDTTITDVATDSLPARDQIYAHLKMADALHLVVINMTTGFLIDNIWFCFTGTVGDEIIELKAVDITTSVVVYILDKKPAISKIFAVDLGTGVSIGYQIANINTVAFMRINGIDLFLGWNQASSQSRFDIININSTTVNTFFTYSADGEDCFSIPGTNYDIGTAALIFIVTTNPSTASNSDSGLDTGSYTQNLTQFYFQPIAADT